MHLDRTTQSSGAFDMPERTDLAAIVWVEVIPQSGSSYRRASITKSVMCSMFGCHLKSIRVCADSYLRAGDSHSLGTVVPLQLTTNEQAL